MTLKWTKDVPTAPGWYWVREWGKEPAVRRVFYRTKYVVYGNVESKELRVSDGDLVEHPAYTAWAGPLPEPEEVAP